MKIMYQQLFYLHRKMQVIGLVMSPSFWKFLLNLLNFNSDFGVLIWDPIWDPDLGPRFGTPSWDTPIWDTPIWDPDLGPRFGTPI
jgi:hypothetical protein